MGEAQTKSWRMEANFWRVAALGALMMAIAILRRTTGPGIWHELSLRVFYLPILLSAYWYGVPGGLLVALISAASYVNRVQPGGPGFDAGRYAEVVVFHVVGLTVGVLATAQRKVTARYQRAAETLESANQDLRKSHEEIRRIDRLKTVGEIATGLAHEIRHPLASISGALEIIEARSGPASPEAEFSRLAMSEVRRLDTLVWEFLAYARPHDPEPRAVPLHEIVAHVIRLLRVEADGVHVALRVEEPERPIDVLVDPQQIQQVLLNVMLNAVQATPPGKRVLVRQRLEGTEALVDIVDEGAGIPADQLPRIFNPFFTTREQGTGLGLAVAHRITSAHGGSIQVLETSTAGTTFRLRLPASDRVPAGGAPAEVRS